MLTWNETLSEEFEEKVELDGFKETLQDFKKKKRVLSHNKSKIVFTDKSEYETNFVVSGGIKKEIR